MVYRCKKAVSISFGVDVILDMLLLRHEYEKETRNTSNYEIVKENNCPSTLLVLVTND